MMSSARYSRQLAVPEIGLAGQQKLAEARVLIVGAGGLGTPLAAYLGAAGIGHLGIADGDRVDRVNLHRQFLFSESDTGRLKAEVLAEAIGRQNPEIEVTVHATSLHPANADEIISPYHVVCDCTDNLTSRQLIDSVCGQLQKPLIYAAVGGWEGYVTVLHGKRGMALGQVFHFGPGPVADCGLSGIVPSTCGIAAGIQAGEVMKWVLGLEGLDGRILCFDALEMIFREFRLKAALTRAPMKPEPLS